MDNNEIIPIIIDGEVRGWMSKEMKETLEANEREFKAKFGDPMYLKLEEYYETIQKFKKSY